MRGGSLWHACAQTLQAWGEGCQVLWSPGGQYSARCTRAGRERGVDGNEKETWTWQCRIMPSKSSGKKGEGAERERERERGTRGIREIRETKAIQRGKVIKNWQEDKSAEWVHDKTERKEGAETLATL